ncbi:MAG: oxygen-independent coproporphyrinogen III oxidase [Candidatus Dadabacteria bacterium]|nr:MAG: oxygen-independent coproporphyrinogen III oxidase [Candidatus Dadabacteria bacterium]
MTSISPELLERLDARLPRYTSYPTAVEFEQPAPVDAWREQLATRGDAPAGVYVHLPFCRSLCLYCGCTMALRKTASDADPYLDQLHREIELVRDLLEAPAPLAELHLGGGTPNFLTGYQLTQLMQALRRTFPIIDDVEISIELDPRTVSPGTVELLGELGFNRFSLGVQDFNPDVQLAINRIQPFEMVAEILEACRNQQTRGVNFDLIYGLPHQTVASFRRTLEQVIELRPDRIAVYNFAWLPDLKPHHRKLPEDALPDRRTKFEIYLLAVEMLTGAGYVHIGMDHFALPDDELTQAQQNGTLRRNFQGYSISRSPDTIAFGLSSIGRIGNVFAQNTRSFQEYARAVNARQLPLDRGLVVDEEDRLRERIIQQIMCFFQVDFDAFETETGVRIPERFPEALEKLAPLRELQLVDWDDHALHASETGRHFVRNIASAFDRHRGKGGFAAFSRAV